MHDCAGVMKSFKSVNVCSDHPLEVIFSSGGVKTYEGSGEGHGEKGVCRTIGFAEQRNFDLTNAICRNRKS